MPARLSGVDAISPAVERTKRQLFKPFRFGRWTRLAVVSLLTGELSGGGGWSGSNFNLPAASHQGRGSTDFISPILPSEQRLMEFLPWILAGVVALVVFFLFLIYVSSIFRFILFEAVLRDRCEIRNGWRRWRLRGRSYFLWQIGFGLASLAVMGAVVGLPVAAAWYAGVFDAPGQHVLLLVIGGAVVFLLFMAAVVLSALAELFAKDFVVPLMALDDLGVLEGWRRLWPMLGAEKGAYTIYVLMKIVLAIGSALIFTIIDVIVLLTLLIPFGIAAIAIVLAGAAAGLTWNAVTIGLAIVAGIAGLLAVSLAMAFVSAPGTVFFQSYTLHFFGPRYPRLESELFSGPASPNLSGAAPPAPAPLPAT